MRQKLNVAIVGAGFIGPIHLENARRTFEADVTALVGYTIEEAKEKAQMYSVPRYYDNIDEMLEDDSIDIVHICSPNYLHYEMAKKVLLANKHCVCEKPLTLTAEEAKELISLAREKNLVTAVHFNVRYYPLVRHAKEMVRHGDLGRLLSVTGSYLQDWLLLQTDYSWRLESSVSGKTRAIGDIGSHWMDLTEYVSGLKITEVFADFATFHKTRKKPKKPMETWSSKILTNDDYQEVPVDTEDYASVLVHYDNGAQGVFTVNQMAAGHKNRVYFEIDGTGSSVIWNSERPNEITVGHREKGNEVIIKDPALVYPEARELISYPGGHNEGFADTSKHLFKEVYDYILAGDYTKTPSFPTFLDGYREVILCAAICESAETGQWVKVEE
ncbi:MAG TPA: Gfo/Idh/MocA family oxidoreductase [Candidatus Mediterraneibacter excrementipullorum]|nr:Gfo/Idh/MocA family oxidoreductase [Candidatus Mediterraneibacter excrementipullorum]